MRRKIGDIFEVVHEGTVVAFVHYLCDDATLPGSNVIAVFVRDGLDISALSHNPLRGLVANFYAHVFLKAGETLGVWRRVGNDTPSKIREQLWCSVPLGDLRNESSDGWLVWNTGASKRKPSSLAELVAADLGFVMSPEQIIIRVLQGKYSLPTPKKSM